MIGATAKRLVLAAVVVGLFSGNAWSQPQTWDPERYLEVVQEGDTLCEQALTAPDDDDETYQELMFDCLRAKEAALEMLRRAVLQNQVGQIEELWDEANRDLFNLTENVIVLYILLDQCIAADTILSRALREPELLPEGGVNHLEMLIPEIGECAGRITTSEPVFDEDRYGDLLQVAQSWRQQAYDRAEDDVEGRSANLYEASQNYGEALGMLRTALMDGVIASDDWEEELFLVYNELITVLLEMNLCAGAQRRVRQAIGDAETFDGGDPAQFLARQSEVQDCQARLLASLTPPAAPEEPPEPEIRQTSDSGVAAYVLWGVGGAAGITALILYLTGSSDRDERDALGQECQADPDGCDFARYRDLNDTVNTRTTTVGVLVGGAIVTAAVGTILFFAGRGGEDAPAEGAETDTAEAGVPYFTLEGLGGSVGFRF